MYSRKVQRLLQELPNRGGCTDPTHIGRSENPVCGDVTEIELKVIGELVVDCCFRASGCPGAVAAAAGLTEFVKGKTLKACEDLSVERLLEFLKGLPEHKKHGADLAITAFRNAFSR